MAIPCRTRAAALMTFVALVVALGTFPLTAYPVLAHEHPACSDSVDNDGDSLTDYPADHGCEGTYDDNEGPGIYRDAYGYPPELLNLPPLLVSITDGKEFAQPGESLEYRIVVENPGPDRRYSVKVQLPVELALTSASEGVTVSHGTVEWRNQTLPAGAAAEYRFTARIGDQTPDLVALRVRATAGSTFGTDTTSVLRGVVPGAFQVSVSDGVTEARPGDELGYEIVVRNHDTKLATEVDVNAALPLYAEFVGATEGGQWTGKSIRWTGLTVSPKGERVLHVALRVRSDAPLGASIQFVADVRGQQGVDITRVGSVTDAISPQWQRDVLLRKTADRTEVRPGDSVRFTIYLKNTTGHDITNILVEDRMDLRFMQVVGGDRGLLQGDRIVWEIPALGPGQSWQVHYTVRVAPHTPHGEHLKNVVSVSGDGMESISLTQRVYTSAVSVVQSLPPTGAAMDMLFLGITAVLGALQTAGLRRKVL